MSYLFKSINIIHRRLQIQGLRVTLIWVVARFIPRITGIPIRRFSELADSLSKGKIFIGAQFREQGRRWLLHRGVDACVNMRLEYDDAAHNLALPHYCYLPTVDDQAPSLEQLAQGVAFIQERVAQGSKVYIHCAGGVGRAATMTAAYYISQGLTIDAALNLIRKTRPFIFLHPPQEAQLKEFSLSVGQLH